MFACFWDFCSAIHWYLWIQNSITRVHKPLTVLQCSLDSLMTSWLQSYEYHNSLVCENPRKSSKLDISDNAVTSAAPAAAAQLTSQWPGCRALSEIMINLELLIVMCSNVQHGPETPHDVITSWVVLLIFKPQAWLGLSISPWSRSKFECSSQKKWHSAIEIKTPATTVCRGGVSKTLMSS